MDKVFQETRLIPFLRVDSLYTIHYFEYSRDYLFRGEKHDFWELAYVDKGEAGVMADSEAYLLKTGEAIFHRPNEYHSIWANGQFTNAAIVSFTSQSPAMQFFQRKIVSFSSHEKDILAALLKEGRRAFLEPLNIVDLPGYHMSSQALPGAQQMIQILLEQLLISLIRNAAEITRDSRRSGDSRNQHEQLVVQQISQFLARNINQKITLDDVCTELLFSRTYLKSVFKKWTGDSIMHHFLVMKIDESKRLISRQQYTFSEISQMLNFCSVHHFSRTFSRIAHLSPREYARSVQSRGIL